MNLKKAASLVVALTLSVTGLAACNRDGGTAEGGQTIHLLVSTLSNPFFVQLRDGAQKEADALGVKLQIVDAQDDAATQTNQLNDALTTGASAVIVNPVDSDAVVQGVTALLDKDIPVIAVDRGVTDVDVTSYVSSDNSQGGELAAQALAAAISETGDVVVLQGVAGSSASRDRGAGFDEGIAAFADIKVAAKQTANFSRAEGLDVATNLMQANSGVVGIFAENDEMALGAVEALGARVGKDVFVVGFDGTEEGLKAVADGTMVATIAQQPEELGKLAVQQAKKALDDEEVTAVVPVEVVAVTKDNVADFQ
ncbi:MAG: substrate-binding domain-containing protein [Propionibacteriaceae bacterium]|nr:substrate-binding domain-containing protein [Propionibacteriaceae bacterium]